MDPCAVRTDGSIVYWAGAGAGEEEDAAEFPPPQPASDRNNINNITVASVNRARAPPNEPG